MIDINTTIEYLSTWPAIDTTTEEGQGQFEEIQDIDAYRDRITFVRDDMGTWWADVQYSGNGRGYMYGNAGYGPMPEGLNEILNIMHAKNAVE